MALSDSKLAMWETIVALVHADGEVHSEEDTFLRERFEKLAATPEQKQELLSHIQKPGNPRELFKKITEPSHRANLIHLARMLFYSDGDFSAQEKQIFELLESDVMGKVDITEAMHKADLVVAEFQAKEQMRRDSQPLHRRVINAIAFWEDFEDW